MNTNFNINHNKDLIYLTIPSFEKTKLVKHCFTTRVGGVSSGIYSSLNTSLNKTDSIENVKENLEIVCSAVGINYENLVLSDQIHDGKIRIVGYEDRGKGIIRPSDIKGIDALVTNAPNVPLITFYADCVPIFFLDTINRVIALAHAGWKGTVLKIGAKTLKAMQDNFGTKPDSCLFGIGPSIEMDCFEVGFEVVEKFCEAYKGCEDFIKKKDNGKYLVDLWKANAMSLIEAGARNENITVSNMCTKCNSQLFFSHRRQGNERGSLSAIMELNDIV